MSKSQPYSYETKCRRCGNIEEWFIAQKNDESISHEQVLDAISDKIEHPRLNHCKKCNKTTVQDVVSANI